MMQATRVTVSEEQWRRAVRKLQSFTVSELAAELGCSKGTAKRHLDEMAALDYPLVKPAGRLGRMPMFQYIKPQDAGERFTKQQALRDRTPPEATARTYGGPIAGTGRHPASVISATEVRKAVIEVMSEGGWRLHPKGDGHWDLIKGDVKVPVAGTPTNPSGTARRIKRLARSGQRRLAA